MPIEYEAKLLDIDPTTTAQTILDAGGTLLGTSLQRRYVYDIDPNDQTTWIRPRDNGTNTTLAVKEIAHDGIDGTTETETTVSDFDATHQILAKLGYTPKGYQENTRTSFTLGPARLEIDQWPHIPPYLEIEADTPADVHATAHLLGINPDNLTSQNTTAIYQHYGIDLAAIPHLTFEGPPPCPPHDT